MGRWAGRAEQRQAAGTQAGRPAGAASHHHAALQKYLELESTDREPRPEGPDPVHSPQLRSPRAGLDPHKRSRTLHQEHLRIAGCDVEVTEDEVGVAELHLE